MFIVENSDCDISHKVRIRTFNFGKDDLGDRSCDFVWKESIEFFLSIIEDEVNDFIQDCCIEDKKQAKPDIKFLYDIKYPSTKQLFDNHQKYFLELISDYPDLVTYPFFSNPYISSDSLTSGFAISTLDSVNIEENEIIFKGKGFYFPNELNYN